MSIPITGAAPTPSMDPLKGAEEKKGKEEMPEQLKKETSPSPEKAPAMRFDPATGGFVAVAEPAQKPPMQFDPLAGEFVEASKAEEQPLPSEVSDASSSQTLKELGFDPNTGKFKGLPKETPLENKMDTLEVYGKIEGLIQNLKGRK